MLKRRVVSDQKLDGEMILDQTTKGIVKLDIPSCTVYDPDQS